MDGYFDDGNLYLDLEVSGTFSQSRKKFKAQVDTGYSGYLTLQYTDAFPLGLVLAGTKAYTIADGSTMYGLVALGKAFVDGKEIIIPIDIQPKGAILLGMQLLKSIGQEMVVNFKEEKISFRRL